MMKRFCSRTLALLGRKRQWEHAKLRKAHVFRNFFAGCRRTASEGGDRHPAGEAGPTTSRLLCRFLGNSLTGDGGTACFLVVREKTIMKLKFFFKYKVRFFSKFLKKYAITLKIQYILSWKTLKPLFFGAPNNVPMRCPNDGAFNEKLHNLKYIQPITGI